MEEIVVEEKQRIAIKFENRVLKTKKYKTSDGGIFDNKERALEHEKYLEEKNKIISIEIDSMFAPECGKFYFFKNFEEMDLIIKNEYDIRINNNKWSPELAKERNFRFPGWYHLQHNDGGDYHDYTEVCDPDEVEKSMKEALEAFSYMSVVANH